MHPPIWKLTITAVHLQGVAAQIEHELSMKQEELEFAKEQLKDEEAEAQLAALLKKYARVRDDFERYEAAGKDSDSTDRPLVLAKIKVHLTIAFI